VCGRRTLVPEPERDNSDIHSALKHVHGGRVPDSMRETRRLASWGQAIAALSTASWSRAMTAGRV
jgi:hypothetical protein